MVAVAEEGQLRAWEGPEWAVVLAIKEHRLVIIIIALVFELQVVALPVKVGWVHQWVVAVLA